MFFSSFFFCCTISTSPPSFNPFVDCLNLSNVHEKKELCSWSVFNVVCIIRSCKKKHIGRAQTLMVQVARRSASVLKRRKSRNRMEVPAAERNNNTNNSEGPSSNVNETSNIPEAAQKDGDNEVIYYMEEPHAIGERELIFDDRFSLSLA